MRDTAAIRDAPPTGGDLAPTGPAQRTRGTYRYGVLVAFALSAVVYHGLSTATREAPGGATVVAE